MNSTSLLYKELKQWKYACSLHDTSLLGRKNSQCIIVSIIHREDFPLKDAEFTLGQIICFESRILTTLRWSEVKIIWTCTWMFLMVFGKYHMKKFRLPFQKAIDYMPHMTSELKLPRIMSLSTLDSEWDHPNYIAPAETTRSHKYHTSWHRPDELFRWVLESQEILLMYLALNHYVLSQSVMLPKSNWNNATVLSLGLYNTAYPHVC